MTKRSRRRSAKKNRKQTSTTKPRSALSNAAAKKFLAIYKEAWETRNPEQAANLFTRDAHYWETPFSEPAVGREAICTYWKRATEVQEDIHFTVNSFFIVRYQLVAEWSCSYTHSPTGEHRELAGILLADFYGGQVRTFREYWQRRLL
jgi:hypothetical protein